MILAEHLAPAEHAAVAQQLLNAAHSLYETGDPYAAATPAIMASAHMALAQFWQMAAHIDRVEAVT